MVQWIIADIGIEVDVIISTLASRRSRGLLRSAAQDLRASALQVLYSFLCPPRCGSNQRAMRKRVLNTLAQGSRRH